jgi:hypothetical protein
MEMQNHSVLMLSAPAIAAVLVGVMLAGGMVPNTTDKFSEGFQATGYVTVSQVRNGVEIFHYEDHNAITETGIDFIVDQISDSAAATPAQFIGLTSTDITPDDDDTTLSGEIDTGGQLDRKAGTFGGYTYGATDDDDNYTISATFNSDGTYNNVQGAGMFTDVTPGADTMVAINEFAPVNLANGDTLTITWTIDLGLY